MKLPRPDLDASVDDRQVGRARYPLGAYDGRRDVLSEGARQKPSDLGCAQGVMKRTSSRESPARTRMAIGGAVVLLAAAGVVALLLLGCSWDEPSIADGGVPAEAGTPEATPTPGDVVSAQDAGVSDGRVLFGQSAAFSGPAQELGKNMRLGIEAAFHEVNQRGGVQGRTLELSSLDDAYEPEAAVTNTIQLIVEEEVFALIGEVGTPTSRSATPVAAEAGVPFIAPFTGAEFLRRAGVAQHHQFAGILLPGDRGDGRPFDHRPCGKAHRCDVPGRLLWARRLARRQAGSRTTRYGAGVHRLVSAQYHGCKDGPAGLGPGRP